MSPINSARKDFIQLLILFAAALIIFYPVLYTEYAYTDELVGLWQWRSGIGDSSGTLLQYGRYITGRLAGILFGSVSTIKELTWIRVFSLAGWMLSIPVWYFALKRVIQKEKLPAILAFFAVLYMICIPSLIISVGWAACFEMFLANTTGLLSGYFLYTGIGFEDDRIKVSGRYLIASIVSGVFCLFTYQNCFGCFFLPFLLVLISTSRISRKIFIGVTVYLFIYAIYYALFRYSLNVNHIEETVRTGLHINVGNKLPFFLARPLNSAFHFTYLFNESSIPGVIVYFTIAGAWLVFSFIQRREQSPLFILKYFVFVFCFLGLIYLPSLVIKENFASNRTLFALSFAVFLLVAETFLRTKLAESKLYTIVGIVSILFVINAWYNFNKQFLQPVSKEYAAIRGFIEHNYHEGTDTINFIRPHEDFFAKQYGITRSWDEFGVPSTFFGWTPQFLVKQIILEKTGKKEAAEKITVKSLWIGKDEYLKTADTTVPKNSMHIDAEEILKSSE